MGREREASDWLRHSRSTAARVYRAKSLVDTGQPQAALEAIGDHEDDSRAARILAEAHVSLGETDAARDLVDVIEADDPAGAAYVSGRLADLEGEHGDAMAHYRNALELDPAHGRALFRLSSGRSGSG